MGAIGRSSAYLSSVTGPDTGGPRRRSPSRPGDPCRPLRVRRAMARPAHPYSTATSSPSAQSAPDFAAVRRAAERLLPIVHRTPVATCATLDRLASREPLLQMRASAEMRAPSSFAARPTPCCSSARRRRGKRRRHPQLGQPRRCPGAGRADARHPGAHRHAAHRFAR